jgi:hypothetical protein
MSQTDIATRRDENHAPLDCLRWDDVGRDRLAGFTPAEWTFLIETMRERNGLGLLARRLSRAAIAPPEEVVIALRTDRQHRAIRHLRAKTSIIALLKATERPALLLKGIDLATRVYGDVSCRSMGDIDILVQRDDVAVFDVALRDQGFIPELAPTEAVLDNPAQYHVLYTPPQRGMLPIELHWRLSRETQGVDLSGIWQRSLPAATSIGPLARVMAVEDLLPYLALHMRAHGFDTPLTQLWDIAEVLAWLPDRTDFGPIWARAREWGMSKALAVAFHQAHACLGIDVSMVGGPTLPPEMRGLVPNVVPNLGRHTGQDAVPGRYVTTLLARGSRWSDRWTVIHAALLPPLAELAQRYDIPERSIRLYAQYPKHWLRIWERKRPTLVQWLRGGRDARQEVDSRRALHVWIDR